MSPARRAVLGAALAGAAVALLVVLVEREPAPIEHAPRPEPEAAPVARPPLPAGSAVRLHVVAPPATVPADAAPVLEVVGGRLVVRRGAPPPERPGTAGVWPRAALVVPSGDVGHWDARTRAAVLEALRALAAATPPSAVELHGEWRDEAAWTRLTRWVR